MENKLNNYLINLNTMFILMPVIMSVQNIKTYTFTKVIVFKTYILLSFSFYIFIKVHSQCFTNCIEKKKRLFFQVLIITFTV